MNAMMKPVECEFDSSNIRCVRAEFVRLADDIQDNWEAGDLAAACNAMSDFGGVLKEAAHTGSVACQAQKRQIRDAIRAIEVAWPTNQFANAVGYVVGIAEAMKSS